MERAFQRFFGVCLIISVWIWMLASTPSDADGWYGFWILSSRVILACFVTGPVYREYLR